MFLKTHSGKSYVNADKIYSLYVSIGDSEKYYVVATLDGEYRNLCYLDNGYNTEAEALAALDSYVQKLQPASGKCSCDGKCSCTQARQPIMTPESLANKLHDLVDEFICSGDADNLLRTNAYIRHYLEQENKK